MANLLSQKYNQDLCQSRITNAAFPNGSELIHDLKGLSGQI
jgi:hypothetical protein